MGDAVTEHIDLVRKRADIMGAIEDEPLELRTIENRTGASRSTVNRAIRSLEEAGLVERLEGAYTLTTVGRMALDHHRSYTRRWEDLIGAADVLDALPRDAPVDPDVVAGGEAIVPPEEAPYRPIQRHQANIEAADRYRGVLPALPDPRGIRLLYEHVTTDGNPAELIVSEELRSSLIEGFPRRLPVMAEDGEFDLLVGDVPPFGLVLTGSGEETTVTLIAFGDSGGVDGVIRNDEETAVRWAERTYSRLLEGSTPATDTVREAPDGGMTDLGVGVDDRPGTPGPSVTLNQEGFVRVDRSYLIDREVAAPATAWRAGLDLAEVHTGYAAERTDGDGEPLTDRLIDALADGEDRVLLGPPGSGKSTTAKRVACRWYEAGRGPVFYREGGRGSGFDAVGELIAALDRSEGHALVVVEDAVRREADAVFDAVDALAGRDDVSFLLDAREVEWRDPPGESPAVDDADLRVEHMPPLTAEGYERLIEQFERTANVTVDVPVATLREEIRADSPVDGADGTAPGEVLLLLHRLSAYADPLADRPTGFEEAVAGVQATLAEQGEGALAVGAGLNLLNAAGIDVAPAHVYALAVAPGAGSVDRVAVESALAVLEDEAVFGVRDGTYRTVHEAWSTTFLATLLETDERTARDRVRRVLAGLFALADDADLRDQVRGVVDDPATIDRIAADPTEWADETVERLFALARERPKLAALFGDADGPTVDLPPNRSSVSREDVGVWLGQAFLDAADYDRAESVFEGIPEDGERRIDRLLGLARVAERRGEYDAAEESARRCLSLARGTGDRQAAPRARKLIGDVALARSEYDRGREQYEVALEAAREAGDRRFEAECLRAVGDAAQRRDEYEVAREYYEESLAIRRETGDRHGQAKTLKNLGAVAFHRAEWDRAREYSQRCLNLCRELGDQAHEASVLNNLGGIALRRGTYDRAREYYEESLAIKRELGDRSGIATTLANLGVIENEQTNPAEAEEYLREAIEINRDLGNRKREAHALNSLANIDLSRGEYDAALEGYERALDINREIGDRRAEAENLHNIGGVASQRGDYERALEHYEESLAMWRDMGVSRRVGTVLVDIAEMATERGEYDRTEECLEEALAVFEEIESPGDEAECRLGFARLARERGAHDRCDEQVTASISLYEAVEEPAGRAEGQLERARLALATGDPGQASEAATAAREVFETREMRHWIAKARLLLGRAAAAEGDHDEARGHYEAALETFEAVGASHDVIAALRGLVGLADQLGVDPEQVDKWCERAARHSGELSLTHDDRAWVREHC